MSSAQAKSKSSSSYLVVIDICCLLFMFVNMGVSGTTFNVFQPYINSLPNMNDTFGSWVVAIRMLSAFAATFFVERFYGRFNCRVGVFIACLLVACSTLIYGFAHSFVVFALGSIVAGFGYGFGGTVAMTLVVGRWFTKGKSTALGIASMGTGIAAIVLPPAMTFIIEGHSLHMAFFAETALCVVIALVVFALLRNYPPASAAPAATAEPASAAPTAAALAAPSAAPSAKPKLDLSKSERRAMCIAILLIGICSVGANAYLSAFVTSCGFGPYQAALVLSVSGVFLMASKPIAGIVMDKLGGKKGSTIFFALFVLGQLLLCFTPLGIMAVVVLGAAFAYSGQPLSTMGVSTWALDSSTEQTRAHTIGRYQRFFTAGTFICNLFPGLLYDWLGTYLAAYIIFFLCIAGAAAIVLGIYHHHSK